MGLMDALRRAEEQGKSAAQRGLDRARAGMENAESRIRRRMRVVPVSRRDNAIAVPNDYSSANQDLGIDDLAPEREHDRDNSMPQPIVSVNGRDIEKPNSSGKRRSAA